jgi:mono/diheme cytochrome c family protein
LIARGEQLAALGACAVCHTKPGGAPLAGGLPMPTPFGTIFSTNVTPDKESGIGAWSEEAFRRAMHEGIDRKGGYLYPAFPYDHFIKVTAEDVRAIYAYLMTRRPVRATAPPNELTFPFNIRLLMAGWNLLFLDRSPWTPDPGKSEAWNRGAYYVQGLGHCGSCHTPRNVLGAERKDAPLRGGEVEGWHAPALGTHATVPLPWTVDALVNYLIDGWDEGHGVAAGPMSPVVNQLAKQPEEVVRDMAIYLADLAGPPPRERAQGALAFAAEREFAAAQALSEAARPREPALQRGEAVFVRSCANCHRRGGQTVPLALTSTVAMADPRNAIHVVLHGIKPPDGAPERSMPSFGGSLSDEQAAELIAFVRAQFSRGPAWNDLALRVRAVRQVQGSQGK